MFRWAEKPQGISTKEPEAWTSETRQDTMPCLPHDHCGQCHPDMLSQVPRSPAHAQVRQKTMGNQPPAPEAWVSGTQGTGWTPYPASRGWGHPATFSGPVCGPREQNFPPLSTSTQVVVQTI